MAANKGNKTQLNTLTAARKAEAGTRKGSTTAQMLEFYAMMANGMRHRITELEA